MSLPGFSNMHIIAAIKRRMKKKKKKKQNKKKKQKQKKKKKLTTKVNDHDDVYPQHCNGQTAITADQTWTV